MTTEDIIERFIDEGLHAYKKNYRHKSLYARRLDRHEPIEIDGYEFSCWREYVVYKMAQYIKEIVPDSELEVDLDGNNSTIRLALSEEEQRKLNGSLFSFLKKVEAL